MQLKLQTVGSERSSRVFKPYLVTCAVFAVPAVRVLTRAGVGSFGVQTPGVFVAV